MFSITILFKLTRPYLGSNFLHELECGAKELDLGGGGSGRVQSVVVGWDGVWEGHEVVLDDN